MPETTKTSKSSRTNATRVGGGPPARVGGRRDVRQAQGQQLTSGQFTTYVVRSGDTLSKIARNHAVEGGWQALAELNSISDAGSLQVGQKLRIPAAAQGRQAPEAGEWMAGKFKVTHYTFAMESDPKHADSPKVAAPGLDPEEKYKQSFLGTPYGIKMQGTGLAENGKYIMYVGDGRYAYGIGGKKGRPEPWKTIAVDPAVIPLGSKVVIEGYEDKGVFLANDTGGGIDGREIDVFVGPVPIAEAYALGTKQMRVKIVDE